MQVKTKLFSQLFTNRFFENTFVSFEVRQTIVLLLDLPSLYGALHGGRPLM